MAGQSHFSQASNTPFASGPIKNLIGPFEFNEHSEVILNGTFDIDAITNDILLQDIVKAMAHSNPNSPITSESELTVEKIRQGFLYIQESTASSLEGLHHGHLKMLIKDKEAFTPYAQMIMFAFKWA